MLLVNPDPRVSLAVLVLKVIWEVLDLKVVKDCKDPEERQANPVFPESLVLQDRLEKMVWPVTKVAKVKQVSLELLVSPVLVVLLALPVVLVLLVLKVILESQVLLVSRESKV